MGRWLGPADAALQQVTWWAAVFCAARGATGIAAATAAATVAAHVLARRGERRWVGASAAAAAVYGIATDSLLAAVGVVEFAGGGATSPPWMVALWAVFGTALTASLRKVAAWPRAALSVAAALAGPLAYRAGAALGALSFPEGTSLAAGAIALQWAAGIPLIAKAARAYRPRSRVAHEARAPRALASDLRQGAVLAPADLPTRGHVTGSP
jgi:hypothetical protein